MRDIVYEETDETAILSTDVDGEWLESDSVVRLPDWA